MRNQNEFINQTAADWASRNFTRQIKGDVQWGKYIFLFFGLGGMAIFFIVCAIMIVSGKTEFTFFEKIYKGFACSAILLIPVAAISYYVLRSFHRRIAFMDAQGVMTVFRKRYSWEKLYYVNYAVFQVVRKGRNLPKQLRIIELVFEDGRAEMGVSNMEARDLLERMPVQPRMNEVYSADTVKNLRGWGVNIHPDKM